MKLLFDENLSPELVVALADIFQESTHIREVGLTSSNDRRVWEYAAENGYTIITKDADFRQRSFLFGPPPKVIWIGLGDCATKQIADLIRSRVREIEAFGLAQDKLSFVLREPREADDQRVISSRAVPPLGSVNS